MLRFPSRRTTAISIMLLFAFALHLVYADNWTPSHTDDPAAFTFVRIRYDSTGGYGESWYRHEGRDWQRWETDFPQAENNLIARLNELTSMAVNDRPIVLRLTDPKLYDYPFIFMSDVGWMRLSRAEQQSLAEYLERGGFLWVDDFWGDGEWNNFSRNMGRLNPAWQWRDIPKDHAILKTVYELDGCPQIPARIFFEQSGLAFDPPSVHRFPAGGWAGVRTVNFRGLFDQRGRLMAVATHNTDIADGWEREGESEEFFDRFSVKSYGLTVNILVYAMTH